MGRVVVGHVHGRRGHTVDLGEADVGDRIRAGDLRFVPISSTRASRPVADTVVAAGLDEVGKFGALRIEHGLDKKTATDIEALTHNIKSTNASLREISVKAFEYVALILKVVLTVLVALVAWVIWHYFVRPALASHLVGAEAPRRRRRAITQERDAQD